MTITEFLLARIAEDEAVARAAIDPDRPGTHWQWSVPDDSGDPDAQRWLQTTEEFPTRSGVGPLPAFPLGPEFKAEPTRGMAHIARHDPARVLAECEAKRRVVELHQHWPVLVESPPTFQPGLDADLVSSDDPTSFAMRASRQIAWMTEQEFRNRFGDEPPTAPMLAAMAAIWADHPDYRDEWRTA